MFKFLFRILKQKKLREKKLKLPPFDGHQSKIFNRIWKMRPISSDLRMGLNWISISRTTNYWICFNVKHKKCWTQIKVIVLIVTVAAIILFIIQLTSLPSFDKSMILEIQNSFEVQVSTEREESRTRVEPLARTWFRNSN